MQHWFLSYHGENRGFFTGAETFTFFDLIPEGLQQALLQRARLDERENPIFLLNCGNAVFVMNTTHRFIRIGESDPESVFYTDFDGHGGFNSIKIKGAEKGIKTAGYFAEFGLATQSREIVYWSTPSGRPGFAFWNVTKKCKLIGRKYL
jgi:hypothetical protein